MGEMSQWREAAQPAAAGAGAGVRHGEGHQG
jgi:hypothetical protein